MEEFEGLLGPEDVDVDFMRFLKEARDERGRKIFETFSSDDLSFLLAEWARWDKYKRAPWRQESAASASGRMAARRPGTADSQSVGAQWKKGLLDAVEDYLECCAQVIVDIGVVERLLRPENLEVSLRYVLKARNLLAEAATSSSSSTHQKKPNRFRGKQKTMVGKSGKRRCAAGEWAKRVVRP